MVGNGGDSNNNNGIGTTTIVAAVLAVLAAWLLIYYTVVLVRRRRKSSQRGEGGYGAEEDDDDDDTNAMIEGDRNIPRGHRMPSTVHGSNDGKATNYYPGVSSDRGGILHRGDSGNGGGGNGGGGNGGAGAGAVVGRGYNDNEWYDNPGCSNDPVVPYASSPLSGKELQFHNNGDDVSTLGEPFGLASDASRYDESTASVQLSYVQHEAASHASQAQFGPGGGGHVPATSNGGRGIHHNNNPIPANRPSNLLPVFDVNDEISFEARLQPGNMLDGGGRDSVMVLPTVGQPLQQQQQQQQHRLSTTAPSGRINNNNNNNNNPSNRNLSDATATINSSNNSSSLEGLKFLHGEGTVDSSMNSSSLDGLKFLNDTTISGNNGAKNIMSSLSSQQQQQKQYQVQVPPGRLGLLLERSTVRAVAPDCVFATRVNIGDVLVSIDGERVDHLSQNALAAVVHETADRPQRSFTFVRG